MYLQYEGECMGKMYKLGEELTILSVLSELCFSVVCTLQNNMPLILAVSEEGPCDCK